MAYDLEERCLVFAISVRNFCRALKHETINLVYINIEANESLGKQDIKMKIKISRKETKEIQYWLKLLISDDEKQIQIMQKEAEELKEFYLQS